MSEYKKTWAEYYRVTKGKPPRPLLLQAIKFVKNKNSALDLGAGALRDTMYLLEQGFRVTAVDASPQVGEMAKSLGAGKLQTVVVKFDGFDFPDSVYDLVVAMYALPFNPPDTFNHVFEKIKKSLKSGGIFCGQFFGVHDEWASNLEMTFHTRDQVMHLLSDMDILSLQEEELDDKTAMGETKHWHLFHVIARRV